MPDPNVAAAKGDLTSIEEYRVSIAMGLLPIALQSSHPTIAFRWKMVHVQAPFRAPSSSSSGYSWRAGLWVDAWVFGLFHMKQAMDLFTNSWTTLQENKPTILALKMEYEEALFSHERRIGILTEFRMGLTDGIKGVTEEDLRISIDQNLRQVQQELDKLEDGNAAT